MAPDPFRAFHRGRRRAAVLRGAGVAIAAAVLGSGLTLWGVAAASPSGEALAAARDRVSTAEPFLDRAPSTLAAPASAPAPAVPPPAPEPAPASSLASSQASSQAGTPADTLADTGPRAWSISIGATGYQKEIDACQWVRMDLGVVVPIVGAHNYCGGGIVLDMDIGDTVRLAGTGLDGTYVVAESRNARAGDSASAATSGMIATAILQTCYWADDGTVRLLGLRPLG